MKKILSVLLVFVFLQVQSRAFAPDYGGLGLNPVGTYGGTLVPSGATTTSAGGVSSADSLGLFSLGVPQVGLSTGNFAVFIQGGAYIGDIIGYVDPSTQGYSAILSGKSTFTVEVPFYTFNPGPPPTETVTFTPETISVSGSMDAKFSQSETPTATGLTTLLTGTATLINFLFVNNNDGSPIPSTTQTFQVNGVLQSGSTVSPSTITLTTSGGGSGG